MKTFKWFAPALAIAILTAVQAGAFTCDESLKHKLKPLDAAAEMSEAYRHVLDNVSPAGTLPGTVLASPSRVSPNYYFMWIRDAALTMNVIDDRPALLHYVDISRMQQLSPAKTGLGEPKFNVDGTPFDGDWGRPQNDGPALRALVTIPLARQLLSEGQDDYVRAKLYDGRLPSATLIKSDLEYVAHHWRELNFDLWEETLGRHFYTLLAQKAALSRGAELAEHMGDPAAAEYYREQAGAIRSALEDFWDGGRGHFLAVRDQQRGPDHGSGLDVAVILGALHATRDGEEFGVTDDRILATALKIQQAFAAIYQVNRRPDFHELGTAIGRYPEDRYTGYESGHDTWANPWFLATNAYAELYFRAAKQFARDGKISITPLNKPFFENLRGMRGGAPLAAGQTFARGSAGFDLILKSLHDDGDRFLARVRYHSNGGHYSEQFDRDSGYSTGAADLTWSYASLITALRAR